MFEIFVAPHGTPGCDPEGHNDRNGLFPTFGEASDGPAPNLDAALRIVRACRQQGRFDGRATITLLPGEHYLNRPLDIGPRDNGGLTIRGSEEAPATLWGGRPVVGWRVAELDGQPLWEADVSAHLLAHGPFKSLWVAGKLAPRPRWPKNPSDNPRMAGVSGRTTKVELHRGSDRFLCDPADLPPGLREGFAGVDVCVPHFWIEERMPVESIDWEKGEIVSTHCSRFCLTDSHSGQWARYYFDNVGSALSEPGEWFLDRRRRVLRYLPKPGETPENTRVVIPALRQFLRVQGDDAGHPVAGIELRNLRFCATDWDMAEDETLRTRITANGVQRQTRDPLPHETVVKPVAKPWASAVQAAFNTPGTIEFSHARQCAVKGCLFEGVAWYGVRANEGCRQLTVADNQFAHLGAGGIVIDGGDIHEAPGNRTEQVFLDRNHIHHGGFVFPGACGILVTHAARVRIADNHIHHHTYSGISVGWTWGFADNVNSEIRIERNHIHHLGERAGMSDMGGIYLLGKSPGCMVRENIIHDIICASYGGIGLYADQGASLITFERNLVFNIQETCVNEHWSRSNTYRDNLFACTRDPDGSLMQMCGEKNQRFWDFPPQTLRIENNLFLTDGIPVFRAIMGFVGQGEFLSRHNRFWNLRHEAPLIYMANGHWEKPAWRQTFADSPEAAPANGSSVADPQLENPAQGDFRRRGEESHRMPFVKVELDPPAASQNSR